MEWRTDDFQYNASYIDVPVDATLYHLPYMLLLTKLLLGMLQSLTQFVSSTKKHFPLFFPFLYIYVYIYIYRIRGRSWMMSQPNTLDTCSLLCYSHKKAHYYIKY